MNHHTVLFNLAARTVLRLTPSEENRVRGHIENVMNGDGLYDGASFETILGAFFDQESMMGETWVDLITLICNEDVPAAPYI
jgi:hypothetical protein